MCVVSFFFFAAAAAAELALKRKLSFAGGEVIELLEIVEGRCPTGR
jgi:hypothetical protein